jgi:hypothetical protein
LDERVREQRRETFQDGFPVAQLRPVLGALQHQDAFHRQSGAQPAHCELALRRRQ